MFFVSHDAWNTGLMNTDPWRSTNALISSSLADGPNTSDVGTDELQQLGSIEHACDLQFAPSRLYCVPSIGVITTRAVARPSSRANSDEITTFT